MNLAFYHVSKYFTFLFQSPNNTALLLERFMCGSGSKDENVKKDVVKAMDDN